MNAGGPGAGSPGALLDRQRRSCESGRFGVPATELRATASLSLGKLKSRTRPDSAVKAAYMIRWRPQRPVDSDDCGRCRSNPRPDDHHHGATARAKHRWPLLARWREAAGIELQQEMQQADQALAVGVQEAEIARAAKALGQHVLENQPEEISTGERALFRLAGFALR
jgi:hypothetical protein